MRSANRRGHNDDCPGCSGHTSELTLDLESGEYYVTVEGAQTAEVGEFTLTIERPDVFPFRVVDLGVIGFTPNRAEGDTFGINDKGEVVFAATVASGARHAMLWLPEDAYGLAGGAVHDLSILSGSDTPSIARAINESGLVVGQAGGFAAEEGEAIVCDLNTSPSTGTELGTLSGSDWSRAFDISDADPPVVIGDSGAGATCYEDCGEGTLEESIRAFRVVLDGSPTLEGLDPLTCLPSTYGRAVNASGTLAGRSDADQSVIEGAGLDWPDDWDEFLGVMETGSQVAQENYACWMDHYFNAHYAHTCLCAPSCPGADPYGNH